MTKFEFVDINRKRYIRDRVPNECPICHFSIKPDEIEWTLLSLDGTPNLKDGMEIIYQCPRPECNRFFIGRYLRSEIDVISKTRMGFGAGIGEFKLQISVPCTPKKPQIPDEIASVSPSFVEIYSQSITAENYGLNQIAGGGYRKALEFLIKDYCISIKKSAENEIKSSYLGTCINKYIDSPQVKSCSQRAAWLGNDEIHYERKWTDKDISNLKELIILTSNWIQNSILTKKYEKEMPNSDRKKE